MRGGERGDGLEPSFWICWYAFIPFSSFLLSFSFVNVHSDVENALPMSTYSRIRIASISKALTSVALGILYENVHNWCVDDDMRITAL